MPFITTLAGASSTWPIPGTIAHLLWADDLIQQRIAECSGTYGTTYYIAFGTNNAAAGTVQGTPRLCSGVNDIDTFIKTTTGNARFLLKSGDRWKLGAATSGINIVSDRITIGAYAGASGSAPPWLDGFQVPYGILGWSGSTARSDANSNVWSRPDSNSVRWVRSGPSGSFESFLRYPYTRFASGTTLNLMLSGLNAAPPRTFFYTGGTLYVNPPSSGELKFLESAIASGCGINVTNVNYTCIDGLRLTGFGMDSDNSQNYQIRCQQVGTNAAVIKNCQLYWSSHHVAGHYGGPYSPFSGGITTWACNEIGLAIHDNVGSAGSTHIVDYNSSGSQESYAYANRFTHGSLKSFNNINNFTVEDGYGQAMYTHTNGTTKVGFVLWAHNRYDSHLTNKYAAPASIATDAMPAVTTRRTWADYRAYIIDDICLGPVIFTAGGYEPIGVNFVRINGYYCGQKQKGYDNSQWLTATAQVGVAINQIWDVDFTTCTGTATAGLNCCLYNVSAQNSVDIIHCDDRIRIYDKDYAFMTDGQGATPTHSTGVGIFNSIFAAYGACLDATAGVMNAMNQSPFTPSGGQSHCAYYRIRPNIYGVRHGYDASLNPVTLLSSPAPSLGSVDLRLVGRAGSLPSGMYCEFDIFNRQRPESSGSTIGPSEYFNPRRILPILAH